MKILLNLLACLCLLAGLGHAAPGDVDALDAGIVGSSVRAVALQPDGKTVIAGRFDSVQGLPRSNLARLNADGTVDAGFNPDVAGGLYGSTEVYCVALQWDGKILIGGRFTTVGGTLRNNIARLNADGTLDPGFNPDADSFVFSIVVQADGRMLFGGNFASVGGMARNHIARVEADGTLDSGFDPNADYPVSAVAVQTDGQILLGGSFTRVGGIGRKYIARVASNGTLDEDFIPNAISSISDLWVQADGNILVMGQGFSMTWGYRYMKIARLNADGTLEPGFDPKPNTWVSEVAMQADGRLLLGGAFTTLGGTEHKSIARLEKDGTIDQGFNSSANSYVYGLALQSDGRVLLGGSFTSVGGAARNRFARLLNDPATESLSSPDSTQVVWTRGGSAPDLSQARIELSTDGGVTYSPLPGTAARAGATADWRLTGLSLPPAGHLRARGRVDGTHSSGIVEFSALFSAPAASMPVVSSVFPASGNIMGGTSLTITGTGFTGATAVTIGGFPAAGFTVVSDSSITATTRAHAAGPASVLVSTPGTNAANALFTYVVVPTVTPSTARLPSTATSVSISGTGFSITLGNNSVVLSPAGGGIVTAATATTLTVTGVSGLALGPLHAVVTTKGQSSGAAVQVASVEPPAVGDLDTPDSYVTGPVYAMAMQPDGKTIIAGSFTSVLGQPRNNIARLNADGTLDARFKLDLPYGVSCVAVQTDGKILLGGYFTEVGGVGRKYLARVAADGTLDPGFNPVVNDWVYAMAVQPNGKILIGGRFTSVGGCARHYIARLNTNGTVDTGFNPDAEDVVRSVAVQEDGKILIAGNFTSVGGLDNFYIARLNGDGTLDSGFKADVDDALWTVAVQADGRILVGGDFIGVGGNTHPYFARLNPDGTLDSGFKADADSLVYSVVMQADGRILLSGWFNSVGGIERHHIARVEADGLPDPSFNPNAGNQVYGVAVQQDGKVLLGGPFPTVGGIQRNHFARVLNDPAIENLTVPDATQVLWTRGGTAPEVSQVTFELSTNGGATFTPLPGIVARVSGTANWQLAGLSLPPSGHLRARGRTSGGFGNASSGLVESVVSFGGALTVVEAWRQTHFATTANSGPAANLEDFDKDGLVNLVEFAFGLNPTQPGAGRIPQPVVTAGAATYTFTQPAGMGGVTYGAEWSETLLPGSWTSTPDTGTGPQHVFSVSTAGHRKIFTRLVVGTVP